MMVFYINTCEPVSMQVVSMQIIDCKVVVLLNSNFRFVMKNGLPKDTSENGFIYAVHMQHTCKGYIQLYTIILKR